jgi:hypothetical protein
MDMANCSATTHSQFDKARRKKSPADRNVDRAKVVEGLPMSRALKAVNALPL